MSAYGRNFYQGQQSGSHKSAQRIVPFVMELVKPTSVVDVGCGVGTWLSEFARAGITDYVGIDGAYVPRELLQIPDRHFVPADLTQCRSFDRSFDLALSMEVAEHLAPENAARFVSFLTSLAPVVLFAAAIPYQGGLNHVNEQWQEYWRKFFLEHRYVASDMVRPLVWGDAEVEPWYQQNTILYVKQEFVARYPTLEIAPERRMLNVVHPAVYEARIAIERGPTMMARNLSRSIARAIVSRVSRM